jgi:hypothetical protein
MGIQFGSNNGPGGAWSQVPGSVPASSTVIIDSTPMSEFIGLDYIFTIWSDDKTKVRSGYMRVIRATATSTKESVHGKLRQGSLSVEVNMTVVSGEARLEITNNESFNLNVEVARLLLGG